jgi:hypothetical protein
VVLFVIVEALPDVLASVTKANSGVTELSAVSS